MPEIHEMLVRFWDDLISRPNGPYGFRFLLQPVTAMVLATIDGLKDARTGRSPYFWTILHVPEERMGRINEGIKATARVLLLGLGMELLYQFKVFRTFHIVEAFDIIFVFAFLPYLLLRGPIARIARHRIEAKKNKG